MAVTDLTPGAGPTGGPAATPQGLDPSQPPPGVDPMQWLQYLTQMFGGGAGAASAAANPHGDGPPSVASPQQMYNFGNPPPANGPGPGNVGPVPLSTATGSSVGVNQPGPMTGPAGPAGNLPQPQQNPTPWFTGGNTPMPWNGPNAPMPPPRPGGPAAGPTGGPGGNAPPNMNDAMLGMSMQNAGLPPGPMASGGASGSASTSNPRFIGISAPNASAQNSMRGGPQGTALNLAGLFGRGQPAVNPNVPAANAQPVSAAAPPVPGPLATGKAPLSYGPQRRGMGWPTGPDWRTLAAGRSGYQ